MKLFDEVVAVMINKNKKGLFTVEERMEMLWKSPSSTNVRIDSWHGLLVDY